MAPSTGTSSTPSLPHLGQRGEERSNRAGSSLLLAVRKHPERAQIDFEDRLLLVQLGAVAFAHADDLAQDLGVESLDLIEIIFALEEKFDISIPYNANETAITDSGNSTQGGLGKLETIEQISAAVKGLVGAKTAA